MAGIWTKVKDIRQVLLEEDQNGANVGGAQSVPPATSPDAAAWSGPSSSEAAMQDRRGLGARWGTAKTAVKNIGGSLFTAAMNLMEDSEEESGEERPADTRQPAPVEAGDITAIIRGAMKLEPGAANPSEGPMSSAPGIQTQSPPVSEEAREAIRGIRSLPLPPSLESASAKPTSSPTDPKELPSPTDLILKELPDGGLALALSAARGSNETTHGVETPEGADVVFGEQPSEAADELRSSPPSTADDLTAATTPTESRDLLPRDLQSQGSSEGDGGSLPLPPTLTPAPPQEETPRHIEWQTTPTIEWQTTPTIECRMPVTSIALALDDSDTPVMDVRSTDLMGVEDRMMDYMKTFDALPSAHMSSPAAPSPIISLTPPVKGIHSPGATPIEEGTKPAAAEDEPPQRPEEPPAAHSTKEEDATAAKIEELKQDNMLLRRHIEELTEHAERQVLALDRASRDERTAMERSLEEDRIRYSTLLHQHERLQESHREMARRQAAKEESGGRLNEEVHRMVERIQDLEEDLEEARLQYQGWQDAYKKVSFSLQQASTENGELRETAQRLSLMEEQVKLYREENADLRKQLVGFDVMRSTSNENMDELSNLRHRLEDTEKALANVTSALKVQQADHEMSTTELRKALVTAQEQYQLLTEELEATKSEKNSLIEAAENASAKLGLVNELQAENEKLTSDNAVLSDGMKKVLDRMHRREVEDSENMIDRRDVEQSLESAFSRQVGVDADGTPLRKSLSSGQRVSMIRALLESLELSPKLGMKYFGVDLRSEYNIGDGLLWHNAADQRQSLSAQFMEFLEHDATDGIE